MSVHVRSLGGKPDDSLHRLAYAAAAERIMCRQSVRPCTVAEGLYSWQSNRLAQVALLTDLQLLCAGYREGAVSRACVLSCSLLCLPSMGHGMKKSVVHMAHSVIDLINRQFGGGKGGEEAGEGSQQKHTQPSLLVDNKVPFSQSESQPILEVAVKPASLIDGTLKGQLLLHLLGSKDSTDKAISYSDCSVVLSSSETAKSRYLTDWKEVCIDSALPVPVNWALKCLQNMEGDGFEKWLIALATVQELSATSQDSNEKAKIGARDVVDDVMLSDTSVTLLNPSAVPNIYALLQLVCLDQAHRWKVLTPDTGLTETAGENEECMIVSDFSDASAAAYCSLLASCSTEAARQQAGLSGRPSACSMTSREGSSEGRGEESYCEQFVTVAQQSVNSTRAVSTRISKSMVPVKGVTRGGEGSTFGYGVKMEAGVMDLAGKLLDALTSQTICEGKTKHLKFNIVSHAIFKLLNTVFVSLIPTFLSQAL
jgi:hypothetical protein